MLKSILIFTTKILPSKGPFPDFGEPQLLLATMLGYWGNHKQHSALPSKSLVSSEDKTCELSRGKVGLEIKTQVKRLDVFWRFFGCHCISVRSQCCISLQCALFYYVFVCMRSLFALKRLTRTHCLAELAFTQMNIKYYDLSRSKLIIAFEIMNTFGEAIQENSFLLVRKKCLLSHLQFTLLVR